MKHLFPVAVAQLKSQFSKPLVSVRNSAEVAILHSKPRKPIERLGPCEKKSRIGLLERKGSFAIKSGFKMTDESLISL